MVAPEIGVPYTDLSVASSGMDLPESITVGASTVRLKLEAEGARKIPVREIEVLTKVLVEILAVATKVVGLALAAVVGVTTILALPRESVKELPEMVLTGPVKPQVTSSPATGVPLEALTVATNSIGAK
jgi:hypothetical protein